MKKTFTIIRDLLITAVCVGSLVWYAHHETVEAQNIPQSWELWQESDAGYNTHTPKLYKIQDGACSIYVVTSEVNAEFAVSVATGQGCK